jgi:predicted dehydrogenase
VVSAAGYRPPVRIGLVGLRFGICHLQTLLTLPEFVVVGVADRRDAPEAAALARTYGIPVFREAGELVERVAPEALSVCIAPRGRAEVLRLAAARQLAVYVEKPWAGCVAQGLELAEACAGIAERVMLGFNFRFLPAVDRLSALVDGPLGPGWLLNGAYTFPWNLGPEAWLWDPVFGGGVFNENSCHLLDLVCHLLGEPVAVSAETANPRGMPMPELAVVTLRFPTGAVAALTLGALGAPGMPDHPRLDLVTRHGRATLTGRDHVWERLCWGQSDERIQHVFDAPAEPLACTRLGPALRRFASALRDGTPMPATIAQGQRCVRLADAIRRSAELGRRIDLATA